MPIKRLILLICLILPAAVQAKSFFPEADGELQKNLLWVRATHNPGKNVFVMTFRVWFKHLPEQVFQTLTDTNRLKWRLTNFKDSRTLTKILFKKILAAKPHGAEEVVQLIGANQISSWHNRQKRQKWTDYVFYEFNFPWPLSDRWAVQKVRVDETNHEKGKFRYEYKMYLGNFKTLEGRWELLPVPGRPGWTEFRGRYESDPGIAVPHFLTRQGMITGFKKDVAAYRKILNRSGAFYRAR